MSFRVIKRATFEAAHRLPRHDGKCARLHGHSFAVEVECAGPALESDGPKSGMLVDFYDIGTPLKVVIEECLDHYYLNESIPDLENPTSEELARWIYGQLQPHIPLLVAVTVEETCTAAARYEP